MFKFDSMNIHLQSKRSNGFGTYEDWKAYEKELKIRYGENIIDLIEANNRNCPLKFTTQDIIKEMEWLIKDFKNLPEQPEYYKRVIELLHTSSKN